MMTFHPVLSPSPLEKAFGFVAATQSNGGFLSPSPSQSFGDHSDSSDDAEHDLPPFYLSPPEISLLRSAEENPLEYTLAEADDAVSYVRILLKMLEQVTSSSSSSSPHGSNSNFNANIFRNSPSRRASHNSSSSNNPSNTDSDERILTLDTPMFSEDDAFRVYYQSTKKHKRLVVAHYCIAKIYEIICVSLDSRGQLPTVAELFHGGSNKSNTYYNSSSGDDAEEPLHTIHLETDEWRHLIKILYNRSLDEYTKRGAALILAFVLQAGCERNDKLAAAQKARGTVKQQQQARDEDLLDLFSEEHKTALSPANPFQPESESNAVEDSLRSLVSWLTSRLQQSGHYASLGVVTPTLGVLLSTTKRARQAFVENGGIGYICRHLRAKRRKPQVKTSYLQRQLSSSHNDTNSTAARSFHPEPSPILMPQSSNDSATARQRRSTPTSNNSSSNSMFTPPSPSGGSPRNSYVSSGGSPRNSFVTNGYPRRTVGKSGSFGSSIPMGSGDNILSDSSASQLLVPALDSVEKHLDTIFTGASGAAEKAAKIARAAPAEIAASLKAAAASPRDSAVGGNSPRRSSSSLSSNSNSSQSVQQLYDLVFCLWCLSLECPTDQGLRKHYARDGAVPALAHLLKKVPREKVLRVTLACLRSLSTLDGDSSATTGHGSGEQQSFVRDMIGCGILKSLETVRQRRWNDSDLEDDLKLLQETMECRTQDLTQWSAYEAEIATGQLRWDDLLHTHEFFRVNAHSMEGPRNDFAPLRKLVEILYRGTKSGKLRSSGRADEIAYVGLNEVGGWDEEDLRDDEVCESLAVCLFDVGEFCRNYPHGKGVLQKIGGAKTLVMHYVHHPRDDVREQALLCASKMLVKNWRAIGE